MRSASARDVSCGSLYTVTFVHSVKTPSTANRGPDGGTGAPRKYARRSISVNETAMSAPDRRRSDWVTKPNEFRRNRRPFVYPAPFTNPPRRRAPFTSPPFTSPPLMRPFVRPRVPPPVPKGNAAPPRCCGGIPFVSPLRSRGGEPVMLRLSRRPCANHTAAEPDRHRPDSREGEDHANQGGGNIQGTKGLVRVPKERNPKHVVQQRSKEDRGPANRDMDGTDVEHRAVPAEADCGRSGLGLGAYLGLANCLDFGRRRCNDWFARGHGLR